LGRLCRREGPWRLHRLHPGREARFRRQAGPGAIPRRRKGVQGRSARADRQRAR
jgi:hypothetical protein